MARRGRRVRSRAPVAGGNARPRGRRPVARRRAAVGEAGPPERPAEGRPSQGFALAIAKLARDERLTVREVLARNPNGHRSIVGTPEQVADSIEEWFTQGGADGFNLNTDYFPQGLELIVDQLVPELQRRGLFRREYEATTLRGNLGIPEPAGTVEGGGLTAPAPRPGKRAIVTGGAGGILPIAHALAAEGVDLVLAGRTAETPGEAAAEVAERSGRSAYAVVADAATTVPCGRWSHGPSSCSVVSTSWLNSASDQSVVRTCRTWPTTSDDVLLGRRGHQAGRLPPHRAWGGRAPPRRPGLGPDRQPRRHRGPRDPVDRPDHPQRRSHRPHGQPGRGAGPARRQRDGRPPGPHPHRSRRFPAPDTRIWTDRGGVRGRRRGGVPGLAAQRGDQRRRRDRRRNGRRVSSTTEVTTEPFRHLFDDLAAGELERSAPSARPTSRCACSRGPATARCGSTARRWWTSSRPPSSSRPPTPTSPTCCATTSCSSRPRSSTPTRTDAGSTRSRRGCSSAWASARATCRGPAAEDFGTTLTPAADGDGFVLEGVKYYSTGNLDCDRICVKAATPRRADRGRADRSRRGRTPRRLGRVRPAVHRVGHHDVHRRPRRGGRGAARPGGSPLAPRAGLPDRGPRRHRRRLRARRSGPGPRPHPQLLPRPARRASPRPGAADHRRPALRRRVRRPRDRAGGGPLARDRPGPARRGAREGGRRRARHPLDLGPAGRGLRLGGALRPRPRPALAQRPARSSPTTRFPTSCACSATTPSTASAPEGSFF